jgi:cytochrome c oxidase cbb3-type subunit 3
LTRSELVAQDFKGDKLGPLLKVGRPEAGMPSFNFSEGDVAGIVAFVHDQKAKFEAVGGGRRDVEAADLLTGNAEAGARYFTASCARCHSDVGDLKGIGTRYQGLALMQRMLYPTGGRPVPARPKVTISLRSGQVVRGTVAAEDEFSITVSDVAGVRETWLKSGLKFTVDDPMSAHFDQLAKYSDKDMHDVYAYLVTLK